MVDFDPWQSFSRMNFSKATAGQLRHSAKMTVIRTSEFRTTWMRPVFWTRSVRNGWSVRGSIHTCPFPKFERISLWPLSSFIPRCSALQGNSSTRESISWRKWWSAWEENVVQCVCVDIVFELKIEIHALNLYNPVEDLKVLNYLCDNVEMHRSISL